MARRGQYAATGRGRVMLDSFKTTLISKFQEHESAVATGTSASLITGSLVADLTSGLQIAGLIIGIVIGLLQIPRLWRNRKN